MTAQAAAYLSNIRVANALKQPRRAKIIEIFFHILSPFVAQATYARALSCYTYVRFQAI
jgi:hypothetical protein